MKEDHTETAAFEVNPGGQQFYHEEELDGVSCKFTYIAQGGTNENWEITMIRDKPKKKFGCRVGRPSGMSYLFFQSFSLQLSGAKAVKAKVLGPRGVPLKPEEYKFNEDKSEVSEVAGKFSSQLDEVELYGTKLKKEEL
ncbi:hypothetical protein ScPMuIL_018127 [Solemya velum]